MPLGRAVQVGGGCGINARIDCCRTRTDMIVVVGSIQKSGIAVHRVVSSEAVICVLPEKGVVGNDRCPFGSRQCDPFVVIGNDVVDQRGGHVFPDVDALGVVYQCVVGQVDGSDVPVTVGQNARGAVGNDIVAYEGFSLIWKGNSYPQSAVQVGQ